MRLDLTTDPAAFVKQVADLRRFINKCEAGGGQAALTSRFMTAALIPLLPQLRTELRADEIEPGQMMTAIADLMGNIATTLIQSMYDAPPEAQQEAVERLFGAAHANAMRTIQNDDRMARDAAHKPQLTIMNGGKQQ